MVVIFKCFCLDHLKNTHLRCILKNMSYFSMICIFLMLLFGVHSDSNPDLKRRKHLRKRRHAHRASLERKGWPRERQASRNMTQDSVFDGISAIFGWHVHHDVARWAREADIERPRVHPFRYPRCYFQTPDHPPKCNRWKKLLTRNSLSNTFGVSDEKMFSKERRNSNPFK